MSDYRTDNRDIEQFKKDIKTSHKLEAQIAIRIGIWFFRSYNRWPTIYPAGTDYKGEYQTNKNVSYFPDFFIDGWPTEITRSSKVCPKIFHQKTPKIDRCLSNNYNLVFVNGIIQEEIPQFCFLNGKELDKLTKQSVDKYGIVPMPSRNGWVAKNSYRYDIDWVDAWYNLPENDETIIPYEYQKIIKETAV